MSDTPAPAAEPSRNGQGGEPRMVMLLPCAGSGSRAGAGAPKQYRLLAGRPLVEHTLAACLALPRLALVAVVVAPDDAQPWPDEPRLRVLAVGGATRADSVCNGLTALLDAGVLQAQDWLLVHDAARCLIEPAQIEALMDACLAQGEGGLLALPVPDTLKRARGERVLDTVDRRDLWLAQTPQMFRAGDLQRALQAAARSGFQGVTDEASAVEALGQRPLLVRGSPLNVKITYPEDFALAETVLRSRQP